MVLVIGANDVVNPAARHDKTQPDLRHADHRRRQGHAPCLAIKRSMNPGFAGIENELVLRRPTRYMLFGDAKAVVGDLAKELSGEGGMH